MSEILAETWIRPKNEITVPIEVRAICKLLPGDGLRWIRLDSGDIVVKKIISKIVNNNCGGGKYGENVGKVDSVKAE